MRAKLEGAKHDKKSFDMAADSIRETLLNLEQKGSDKPADGARMAEGQGAAPPIFSQKKAQATSVFTIGNGFLGVQGFLEANHTPSDPLPEPRVFLNGVYEAMPVHYHEGAYGFASQSDSRVMVPDGFDYAIWVDGQVFKPQASELVRHERWLDWQKGLLVRELVWQAPQGGRLYFTFTRFASFAREGLGMTRLHLRSDGFEGHVRLGSLLSLPEDYYGHKPATSQEAAQIYDPRLGLAFKDNPWREEDRSTCESGLGFLMRTKLAGVGLGFYMAHRADGADGAHRADGALEEMPLEKAGNAQASGQRLVYSADYHLQTGSEAVFEKALVYQTDHGRPHSRLKLSDLQDAALQALAQGSQGLEREQAAYLADFWAKNHIKIDNNPLLAQAITFNLYQLLQAVGRDGDSSIGAKGQSGEGYEGHIFWDAESYCLPAFVISDPALARSMLSYRVKRLAGAREQARLMGHERGALYPWRTIGGREASAFFPAGSAQYHINADIAYALALYERLTGDRAFVAGEALDMLFETALLWLEAGFFDPQKDGAFVIHKVTGPDEYSALVDNNFYTNVLARAHMAYALDWLDSDDFKGAIAAAAQRAGLSSVEVAKMRQAVQKTYLPYDEPKGIYAQDDYFLQRSLWDFDKTPDDKYPLLLHYHPLKIYRHQVCKQADTLLALHFLWGQFDAEKVARSFDYYESVTVHDSTLSPSAFAALAARLKRGEACYDYWQETSLMDLENLAGNSNHGLHMAAMAGSYTVIAFGLLGLQAFAASKSSGDIIGFAPRYFAAIGPYDLRFQLLGRVIEIHVEATGFRGRLLEGAPFALALVEEEGAPLYHFHGEGIFYPFSTVTA